LCLCFVAQSQQTKLRVAVLDPTTSGISMDDGTKLAVQELISSTIVNTGRFIIIERSMIDKIIKEQSFQNSDMADNSQATEIGKLAGANKVILSAVSMVGGRNMLSIKMIDVTTASIEQQKTKVVATNDLLDVVEPLTLEILRGAYSDMALSGTFPMPSAYKTTIPQNNKNNTINPDFDYNTENQKIYNQVISGVKSISSVQDPDLVKKISNGKIQRQILLSGGLKATFSESGILTISGNGEMSQYDKKILQDYKKYAKAIVVEDGVKKISGLGGFALFSKLQYVMLPSTLEEIDDDCFSYYANLLAVNIPPNVKRIGKNVFKDCKRMTNIVLPYNLESIGSSTFEGCERLTSIVIPNTITRIPDYLFKGCKSIQRMYVPDNVVSIGEESFRRMKSLHEIHLSENITLIPKNTFEGCESLTDIICPSKVKSVGESAFESCVNLTRIIFLSEDLNIIDEDCFSGCGNLSEIVLYSPRPPVCNIESFDKNCYFRTTVSVPSEAITTYQNANYWKSFISITPIHQ